MISGLFKLIQKVLVGLCSRVKFKGKEIYSYSLKTSASQSYVYTLQLSESILQSAVLELGFSQS